MAEARSAPGRERCDQDCLSKAEEEAGSRQFLDSKKGGGGLAQSLRLRPQTGLGTQIGRGRQGGAAETGPSLRWLTAILLAGIQLRGLKQMQ